MKTETIVLEVIQDHAEARRKPGFYWVRRLGESRLTIGKWNGKSWQLPGTHVEMCDDSFSVIGLEPIRR